MLAKRTLLAKELKKGFDISFLMLGPFLLKFSWKIDPKYTILSPILHGNNKKQDCIQKCDKFLQFMI